MSLYQRQILVSLRRGSNTIIIAETRAIPEDENFFDRRAVDGGGLDPPLSTFTPTAASAAGA